MAKDTFILNTDLDDKTKSLTDDEVGKVFRKILKYVKNKPVPKLADKLELVFDFIKVDLDKNLKKYQDKCESHRRAAEARWGKNQTENECKNMQNMQMHNLHYDNEYDYYYENNNNDILKKENIKEKKKKFIKPKLGDVQAYCLERKNKVDPQRFIDYYESNGWKVGKNAMKDWKAAIRTWEKNDGSFSNKSNSKNNINSAPPEWFNKENHNEPMTEEDIKELDNILDSIHSSIDGANAK